MTPIERMKTSAAESNAAVHRATGAGQKRQVQPVKNGKTAAVARRQAAVRDLMGRGLSHWEIAKRLDVKVSTIKADLMTIKAEDAHTNSPRTVAPFERQMVPKLRRRARRDETHSAGNRQT